MLSTRVREVSGARCLIRTWGMVGQWMGSGWEGRKRTGRGIWSDGIRVGGGVVLK